jgi:uncharacterized protein YvpB
MSYPSLFRQIPIFGLLICLFCSANHAAESPRTQFIALTNFATFSLKAGDHLELLSPLFKPQIAWDELVPSWNYHSREGGLILKVRVIYPDHETAWYCLGEWSWNGTNPPRRSINGQKDADGRVNTDTLKMLRPGGGGIQCRLELTGPDRDISKLRLLTLAFSTALTNAGPSPFSATNSLPPLSVPEHSQADYPEGINSWCSPTATAMVLEYWGKKLGRDDLKYSVPEVARLVNDPNWPGTGNWPFNTAFAGAHEGIRAYVSRLADVDELERWVGSGVPVACSVSYRRLRGIDQSGEGHIIVCVGFDEQGNVIVNDPGRKAVRQVYTRANFIRAWAESRNTVYLIYPETMAVPGSITPSAAAAR